MEFSWLLCQYFWVEQNVGPSEKKMKTEYLEPSGMVEETSQSKQKTEEEE